MEFISDIPREVIVYGPLILMSICTLGTGMYFAGCAYLERNSYKDRNTDTDAFPEIDWDQEERRYFHERRDHLR